MTGLPLRRGICAGDALAGIGIHSGRPAPGQEILMPNNLMLADAAHLMAKTSR